MDQATLMLKGSQMDYKIVNALSCFLVVAAYLAYLKSEKYQELRVSVGLVSVFAAYFGTIYVIAILFDWDVTLISAWLRPPFSADRVMLAVLIIDMVWGERIYSYAQSLIQKVRSRRSK
jgi:hypothetical protein